MPVGELRRLDRNLLLPPDRLRRGGLRHVVHRRGLIGQHFRGLVRGFLRGEQLRTDLQWACCRGPRGPENGR